MMSMSDLKLNTLSKVIYSKSTAVKNLAKVHTDIKRETHFAYLLFDIFLLVQTKTSIFYLKVYFPTLKPSQLFAKTKLFSSGWM